MARFIVQVEIGKKWVAYSAHTTLHSAQVDAKALSKQIADRVRVHDTHLRTNPMAAKKRKPRRAVAKSMATGLPPAKRLKKRRRRPGASLTALSMSTGLPPSKRLKKRRSKNVRKGYFPNPVKGHVVSIVTSGRPAYGAAVGGVVVGIYTTRKEAVARARTL